MIKLTRFDVGNGGCFDTKEYPPGEENAIIRDIGWWFIMGSDLRQYQAENRNGKRVTVVVLAAPSRYEGEDLTVYLWEWEK